MGGGVESSNPLSAYATEIDDLMMTDGEFLLRDAVLARYML